MTEGISDKFYKRLSDELFGMHSIAALIFWISKGFELEFRYKGVPYSITQLKGKIFLSSSQTETSQLFDDIESLTMHSIIDEKAFIEVWDELVLDNM